MYIIGIDLGGTKIEAILVKNDILQPIKKKRIPTESEQGYDAILQKIVKLVLGWSAEINEDFAVGIGIPGVLDPITKTTIRTNIKGAPPNPIRHLSAGNCWRMSCKVFPT